MFIDYFNFEINYKLQSGKYHITVTTTLIYPFSEISEGGEPVVRNSIQLHSRLLNRGPSFPLCV